jgi:hypothetical protein
MNKTVPSSLYYNLAIDMHFVKTAVEKGSYKKAIDWAENALQKVEKYQEDNKKVECSHGYWFMCKCGKAICNKCGEHYDKSVNDITKETLKLVENG